MNLNLRTGGQRHTRPGLKGHPYTCAQSGIVHNSRGVEVALVSIDGDRMHCVPQRYCSLKSKDVLTHAVSRVSLEDVRLRETNQPR